MQWEQLQPDGDPQYAEADAVGQKPPPSGIELPAAHASLQCPICMDLLHHTLTLACGHSVCRLCCLRTNAVCSVRCAAPPLDKKPYRSYLIDGMVAEFLATLPEEQREDRKKEEVYWDSLNK